MRKKFKIISFILIVTFIIPLNIKGQLFMDSRAYASATSQINPRGIVFTDGMASDQIRLLKDFFRARGDKNVPWGYSYDARTKELVRSYQRQNGLGADGIAGKATIDRMNKEIRKNGYNIGLRQPSVNVKGDLILINKSSNTLHFMKNGQVYKSFPVATGKTSGLTPDGRHTVIRKYKNPAWGGAGVSAPIPGGAPNNPLGKRWIGLSVGGGGKYGVHGNSNAKSIGKYASMGCVRMFNEDVEKLYEEVVMNTPVWIGFEDSLIGYGVKFEERVSQNPVKPSQPNKPNKPNKPANPSDGYIVQKDVKVKLDGELVKLNQPILNNKGTTYYPFREILESIGARVEWTQATRTAAGSLDENKVEFIIGTDDYRVNGAKLKLPKGQKAFINSQDLTYIPIRYAMEGLGFKVDWDQASKTILIESIVKEEPTEEPVEKPSEPVEKEPVEGLEKPLDEKEKPLEENGFVDEEYFKDIEKK